MFKVLDGGLTEGSASSRKKFISAYITDTRLMGVVGIFVHWKLTDNEVNTEFFQCFYLDAEEFGFDSYEYVLGAENQETMERASAMADRLLGGLGGKRIEISEREARSLVQDYVYMNVKKKIPIPDEAEIDFILKPEITLSLKERRELMAKQCEEITGDYQLVNYFIMRLVGHDFEAAKYLARSGINFKDFRKDEPATLLRNECELSGSDYSSGREKGSFTTNWTYLCQSLVEHKNYFEVMTSKVTLEGRKVRDFKLLTRERITSKEADFLTRREEYIILNELEIEPEDFNKKTSPVIARSQEDSFESGRLFMIFNSDNSHVARRVFRLYDDVYASVYVTDYGQLIVASFDRENAEDLEKKLLKVHTDEVVYPLVRYSFDLPVLYEFVRSGYPDFEEFIEAVSDSDND